MSKRSLFVRGVTVLTMVAGGGALSAAWGQEPAVLLRPKFAPGSVRYVESRNDTTQRVSGGQFGEGGMDIKFRQIFGTLEKVAAGPEGGSRVTLTFDRTGMGMEMPVQSMSFDSDTDDPQDAENLFAPICAPMIGQSLTLEVDKSGKVTGFDGMDELMEKLEETAGGNPIFEQMRANLTDESGRVIWGESRLILYPDKQVRVGDKWTRTLRQPDARTGDQITEYHCELKRVAREQGRQIAEVSYSGTIRPAPDAKPSASMGIRLEFKSGTLSGSATFDVERGECIKQSTETKTLIEGTQSGEESDTLRIENTSTHTITFMNEAERGAQKAENRKKAEAQAKEEQKAKPDEAETKPD